MNPSLSTPTNGVSTPEIIRHLLPDVDAFGRKGRLSFDPEHVKNLGWVPNEWRYNFNPDHVKDITDTA